MIILIGPSASGKTEVAKELVRDYGYHKVTTYTTRGMRENETSDVDYHFVSLPDFLDRIEKKFFFEYVNYNGNFYGTAKEDLDDKSVVILEPNGFKAYKNDNLSNVVSFFLESTVEKRIERMKFRRDSIEKIKERITNDEKSFKLEDVDGIDYIMNSNDLTISELSKEINDIYTKKIS